MMSFSAATLGKNIKMKDFDFNGLFILDLANNHQGELDHGLNIINALGSVVGRVGVRARKRSFRLCTRCIDDGLA